MLLTRILSAVVLIAILIVFIGFFKSPLLSLSLVMIMVGVGGMEYTALRWRSHELPSSVEVPLPEFKSPHMIIGLLYAITIWVEHAALNNFVLSRTALAAIFAWISLCVLIMAATIYSKDLDLRLLVHRFTDAIAGFVYLVFPGIMLFRLTEFHTPSVTRALGLVYVLAVVYMGDTGAYFIGKAFGKHKLIPPVSPKKTVEGSVGGLGASVVTAVILCVVFKLPFAWYTALISGVVLGAAGQIGDLLESAIKRAACVKDASNLIPGHGGVLDRVDSLLLTAPLGYLLFAWASEYGLNHM